MNRRILQSLLVVLCSLFVAASATAQNTAIVGDMDGDGKLSARDVTLLVNTILGVSPERLLRLADGETPWPDVSTTDVYEYVDLGLPSGTLWATCNIGASAPEDCGDFFAWGETQAKTTFEWSNYVLCEGSSSSLTNYCMATRYGHVDGIAELSSLHDAATVLWGKAWCMPTEEQALELLSPSNTRITFSTLNGNYGLVISSLDGKASIFLPAAGTISGTQNGVMGEGAYYWTKSLHTDDSSNARYMYLDDLSAYTDKKQRSTGCPIRPVRVKAAQ